MKSELRRRVASFTAAVLAASGLSVLAAGTAHADVLGQWTTVATGLNTASSVDFAVDPWTGDTMSLSADAGNVVLGSRVPGDRRAIGVPTETFRLLNGNLVTIVHHPMKLLMTDHLPIVLTTDGEIWQWGNGYTAGPWRYLGGNASDIVGGLSVENFDSNPQDGVNPHVYMVDSGDGSISVWDAHGGWTRIGGAGAMFAEVRTDPGATIGQQVKLYGLQPDRGAVWEYQGTPGQWRQVGGPAAQIVGGGTRLIGTDPSSGLPYFYNGSGGWVPLSVPASSPRPPIDANGQWSQDSAGTTLYYRTGDATAVWGLRQYPARLQHGVVPQWTLLWQAAAHVMNSRPLLQTFQAGPSPHTSNLYAELADGSLVRYTWEDFSNVTLLPVVPAGQIWSDYSHVGGVSTQIQVQVGSGPNPGGVTLAITGGQLPPGVTMSLDGSFHGTPTVVGTYYAVATAYLSDGAVKSVSFVIPVDDLDGTSPPQAPNPGLRAAGIDVANCDGDHHDVHIWLYDATNSMMPDTAPPWEPTDLQLMDDSGGKCPASGTQPYHITFQNGHDYLVAAVDDQTGSCAVDDPGLPSCRRLTAPDPAHFLYFIGDSTAATVGATVF